MNKVTPKQLAISLWQALAEAPADRQNELIKNFVALLARRRQLKDAERIVAAFAAYNDEQNNIVAVTLTTARPLATEHWQRELKAALNKDIRLSTKVNKSILGGAIIQIADTRLDGSVRQQLNRLRYKFSN